jgi:hypothetical protein
VTTGRWQNGVALVVGCVALLGGSAARADSAECVKGSEDGLAARDRGRLREARKHFVTCAADACPKTLRIDCARWLDEVDSSLPTVVFGARDPAGADVFDVAVFVDGEKVTGHEQGKAVALDPGPHAVRFERAPYKPATLKVLLRSGEHNRPILATFASDGEADKPADKPKERDEAPTHKDDSSFHVPTASIVFGAVGVAALGSFAFFALSGAHEKDRLQGICSPHCTDDQVSVLKTRYILADVSLGVGIIALGVAAYFWLTDRSPQPTSYGRFARTIWK